jgi:hypothetical protein
MLTYATPTNTVITLASLAGTSARESRVVNNTSTRYDDVLFNFWCMTTMGTLSGDKSVYVYFYGGNNNGEFPSMPAVTGTDAAIVIASNSSYNIGQPMVVSIVNTATTMRSEPVSVGQFFGGVLPPYWGFIVYNMSTGVAFDATEGSHGHSYCGVYYVGT